MFARPGYAGASVDAIAEQAGFTMGALYSNFATKRELFLAADAGRPIPPQATGTTAYHRALRLT